MRSYHLVTSKPYMCVGAVLEMILRSEGFTSVGQQEIAEFFGVAVPDGFVTDITNHHEVRDPNLWGIRLGRDGLAPFFTKYELPFLEEFEPIAAIPEEKFEEHLINALNRRAHVVCGYSYNALYGKAELMEGHVSLVLDVERDGTIALMDPGPLGAGVRRVYYDALYAAMKRKSDGIWSISRMPVQ